MATRKEIVLEFLSETADAQRGLVELVEELKQLGRTDATSHVDLAGVEAFKAKLDVLEEKLSVLGSRNVTSEVRVKIDQAFADVEKLRKSADQILTPRDDKGQFLSKTSRDVKAVTNDVEKLGSGLATLGDDFTGLAGNANKGSGSLTEFSQGLARVAPMLTGAAIILGIALAGGIAAVGASAAAAVGGLVAMGAALAAAFGPAAIVAVGVMTRLSAVMEAFKASDTAATDASTKQQQAAQKAAQAQQAQQAAAERLANAQDGVARARRALAQAEQSAADEIARASDAERQARTQLANAVAELARAERGLVEARRAASDAIAQAQRQEAAAEKTLADARRSGQRDLQRATETLSSAQATLKQATTDAYRAWADSIDNVRDKQLALESAQLGSADASLRVEEAQARLNKLLAEGGTLAPAFVDALKKLQDVDFGPAKLQGVTGDVNSVAGTDDKTLALKRALLDLAQARLGVAKAAITEEDATKNLNDAQQTANNFATQGIAAYKPYTDAVKGLRDANQALSDTQIKVRDSIRQASDAVRLAEQALHRVRAQGIEQNPQVLNAEDAVRRSHLAVADAQIKEAEASQKLAQARAQGIQGNPRVIDALAALATAQRALSAAQSRSALTALEQGSSMDSAAAKAQGLIGKLSGAERALLSAIQSLVATFRTVMQPVTDAFISGFAQAIQLASGLLIQLAPQLRAFGLIAAQVFGRVVESFGTPAWREFFSMSITLATRLVQILGPALTNVAILFRQIATAAGPGLIKAVQFIADAFASLASKANNTQGLGKVINSLVDATLTWFRVIGPLADVFLNFVLAAAPAGNELVKWIGEGAQKLASWLGSKQGIEAVHSFFHDTIPLAKQIVELVGHLAVIALGAYQAIAPFLNILLHITNFLLEGVQFVLGLFLRFRTVILIIAGVIAVIVAFATGFGEVAVAVGALVRGFIAAVAEAGSLGEAFGIIIDFLGSIGGIAGTVFDFLVTQLGRVKVVVGLVVTGVGLLGQAVESVVGFVIGLFGDLIDGIKSLFGISSPAKVFIQIGKDIIQGLANGLYSLASLPFQFASWLVGNIVGGIHALGSRLISIGRSVVHWIQDGIGSLASTIYNAGRWVLSTIVNGLRSLGGAAFSAGQWVWHTIQNAIGGLATAIYNAGAWILRTIINGVTNIGQAAWNALTNLGHKVLEILQDAVKGGIKVGVNLVKSVGGALGIPGLMAGGIVGSPTLALIGEGADDEAVVPLNQRVMQRLAQAITAEMQIHPPVVSAAAMHGVAALAGRGDKGPDHVEQNFHIPPAHEGGQPDARTTAALLALELRRRGARG